MVIKNVIAPPHINKKKNDKFVILFFGRLGKRKGIYDILDVLSEHREEFINKLEFLFGGDGDVEQVQAIIRERNLNDIAKYQGWVSGIKKERLLNQADAYILPSYNEGLPISVLEAMSYSLPIISTTVGGIPEILKNNENGFIIEPGDKIAIYHAISNLMANEAMAKRMGKDSLSKVQDHLPDYVQKQLQTLYDSLV
ncbi:glycosyl transferases group 1 family protein [Bacteroides fragilis str. 3725 D9 ii]|nr:glycosyl transferases group 1 family protein [Bacteroides ovatus str. 3725 D1 iv]KDS19257.1 glycosyl transferases group 1 family protein [Bacteroides fragilis str. 3725 D9 ii]